MLGSLLLLPLFAALYLRVQAQRRALATRYGGFGLAQRSGGPEPRLRRRVPPALFLGALALLGLALARPQATVSLPRIEGTVILAFDVSGSMAAADLEPSRMAAAKAVAAEFVRRRPQTAQVGVVAFSDGGLAVHEPTSDRESLLAAIERLGPQRGTSVGEGLLAALNLIAALDRAQAPQEAEAAPETRVTPAAIVLLSDGENNAQPDPLAVAQAASQLGVRIYTIGVGTPGGIPLQLDGFSVHTRLEEEALRLIAGLSGGAYFAVSDVEALGQIYDELAAQLVVRTEQTELTALFVGASAALLLVGGLCSLLWFNRLA